MNPNRENEGRSGVVRKGFGITGKLVFAIVGSVVIAVAILLAVVYFQMSHALLDKSEDLLQTTTERTLQETKAWMNSTLAMLETQRDTIEYEDMEIPDMTEYIKHTAGRNDAYPAGLYVQKVMRRPPLRISWSWQAAQRGCFTGFFRVRKRSCTLWGIGCFWRIILLRQSGGVRI